MPKIRAAANVLAGKLFDEHGEPLYSTGAKGRQGGRYRYYVSRELVIGGGSSMGEEKGWRLAAPELEQSVIVSARSILNDQRAIATTLQEAGVSSAEIDFVLKQPTLRARCWNRACKRQPPSLNLLTESM